MGKRIAQVLAGLVGGICISQDVPWKAQKGQPAARFPAYDSQLPTEKGSGKGGKSGWPRDPHDLNDGVTGDVQRALNATKKAEHRLGLRDQVAGVYKSEQVPIRRLASVGLLVQDPPCESQTVAWHLALPGVCRSGLGDVERDLVHAW